MVLKSERGPLVRKKEYEHENLSLPLSREIE